jgi:putative pyruvate formate lyase activating enzyme
MEHLEYRACRLCPRACGVDRTAGEIGYCGVSSTLRIARAALHAWEEPCISGKGGSGTVFFSGCGLRCVFCQNRPIALGEAGREISTSRLADIFDELEAEGAENLNLVTATQFVPSVLEALSLARGRGNRLPVVYNSGGYETLETLSMLKGAVDVYLVDYKYASPSLAEAYASAPDYPSVALRAIQEMLSQTGEARFDGGLLRRGTLVRFLLLPSALLDAKLGLRRVFSLCGNKVHYSLMQQYTPMPGMPPPLDRRVSEREYRSLLAYAAELGIENGYTQERESAKESFIPPYDLTGVLPKEYI